MICHYTFYKRVALYLLFKDLIYVTLRFAYNVRAYIALPTRDNYIAISSAEDYSVILAAEDCLMVPLFASFPCLMFDLIHLT